MNRHNAHSILTLLYRLFWRDLQERYTGTVLGGVWLLVQPLFLLAVYTLVFGEILQLRLGAAASTTAFAYYLFAGLIAFNAFSEVLTRAPLVLHERRDMLLNTPLPSWILPLLPVASSILLEMLAVLILVLALWVKGAWQPWGLLLYLPFLLVRVLLSLAAAYFLSVLGVFLRDLRQLMPAVLTVLLFISPILYPLDRIPPRFLPLYDWNLLGQLVQGYREALLEGTLDWQHCATLLVLSSVLLMLSIAFFRSLMPRARFVL